MRKIKKTRLYTKKSWKLMQRIRMVLVILFFPFWIIPFVLTYVGLWMEYVLDFMESVLDAILDKIIPQIK